MFALCKQVCSFKRVPIAAPSTSLPTCNKSLIFISAVCEVVSLMKRQVLERGLVSITLLP